MFTDEKCPVCGGSISVEVYYASRRDVSLRLRCEKCRETAIYDITPEVEDIMGDFMEYLGGRVKTIEGTER